MLLLKIDRNSPTPIFRQIVDEIVDVVNREAIKPGSRLPTTRTLSESLGVNRSTVYIAYQYLSALGYIESKPGSYTTVRKRIKIADNKRLNNSPTFDWEKVINLPGKEVYDYNLKFESYSLRSDSIKLLNFTALGVDRRLYPTEDFRKQINKILYYQGKDLMGYGDVFGYQPLREYIAGRLQTHGISVSKENVLITSGCQQANELLIKILVTPGKKVIIEAPTYFDILPLLKYYQTEVVEIPMLAGGMDLDHLEEVLKKAKYSFIYTIPNFQNPTGITTSQEHRERLLSLAEKFHIPIIEDGFEEEMKYFGKVVLPIKSMDKSQIVIYLGTFSKALFPGIRIGWLVGEKELVKKLAAVKKFSDLGGSPLTQASMAAFCNSGKYDLHIKRIQRVYKKRMLTALKMMNEEFPDDIVSYTKPDGGYTIWISFKKSNIKEDFIYKKLAENGIMVLPGSIFFSGKSSGVHFRISIAALNEDEITEGIKRIGKVLRELNA